VIIDTSPILAVTDPAIIGAVVDGIVLVVQPSSLKRRDIELTRELLQKLETPVMGILINRIGRGEAAESFGYGYGYGYGSYGGGQHEAAPVVPVRAHVEPMNGHHVHSANGHADSTSSPDSGA
jgi:Mrp family chromosome partitioning ATPase